jgi:hypothetical protein
MCNGYSSHWKFCNLIIYKGNVCLNLTVQNLHIILIEKFFTLVSIYQSTKCLHNVFGISEFYICCIVMLLWKKQEQEWHWIYFGRVQYVLRLWCDKCRTSSGPIHLNLFMFVSASTGVPFTWMYENCFSTTCRPGSCLSKYFA